MRRDYLLRRTGFALAALVAVLTAAFAVIELTANPTVAQVAADASRQAAAENANATAQTRQVERAVREYRIENGLNRPLPVRYVDWMWSVFTLDWGTSRLPGRAGARSVRSLVADGLQTTALWVVPAVVCSSCVSTVAGLAGVTRRTTRRSRAVSAATYLLYGLPNFWLALVALPPVVVWAAPESWLTVGDRLLFGPGVAALAVAGSLIAVQSRYVRSETGARLDRAFVTVVRAKGGGRWTVGRHVLRHAGVTLTSLFVADYLGVLVVEVFVLETALGIDGVGALGIEAIQRQDLPTVLGITFVLAAVGVGLNLLADIAHGLLDPRTATEE
ncbi:MAG: ABC-type dipeptide/oligopeptide/nickel transport system, permease component [halophilic archaeon J07HB67]|jgi:ABC-type dipeptide/oligopeptide/nickel transport systems, permease components|nr:MAG: ABC-type dipeptide/oligopeptide/nickel transport system, permease component [halophilic archaeon J07HB67]